MRLITPPAIGAIESGDEIGRAKIVKARGLEVSHPVTAHSIDAAAIIAETIMREQFVLTFFWQPLRMLDHEAIHVRDPQRTVRSFAHHHGAAPAVFTGEEVELCFSEYLLCHEAHAVVGDGHVLHKIMHRLAGEGVVAARTKQELVTIHQAAAS